jgi:hypothetical protein
MKLAYTWCLLFFFSCADSTDNNSTNPVTDSARLANPGPGDTVKHPSGVDNSSVISRDTAAMNIQNTYKKADSLKKNQPGKD